MDDKMVAHFIHYGTPKSIEMRGFSEGYTVSEFISFIHEQFPGATRVEVKPVRKWIFMDEPAEESVVVQAFDEYVEGVITKNEDYWKGKGIECIPIDKEDFDPDDFEAGWRACEAYMRNKEDQ